MNTMQFLGPKPNGR